MIDRMFCALLFVMFFVFGAVVIHQEQKLKRIENKETALLYEIAELKKKERITAQDVQFLQMLILEGDVRK